MTSSIKTPSGICTGKNDDGVVQYLGIKYASLKDQLSTPTLINGYEAEIVEATKYGARAPAMDGCRFEQNVLIQQSIGGPETPAMSGTDCLNLNITVPDAKGDRPLPVLVFIHGGGFIMGSNHWKQYDMARLVKLSAEIGMPVIGVNINYRLGILGNLTSQELRESGYPGNNSLRDQRCALQWVKAHISDFGGDPESITVSGESAGSVAVLHHLSSREVLFDRAISMSGTPLMLKPLSPAVAETSYNTIMKELGLETASVNERLERIVNMSPDDLVAKTPMTTPLLPFVDGEVIPGLTSFETLKQDTELLCSQVPGRRWCKDLMIGDCQHDGNVFYFMGLAQRTAGIAAALSESLIKHIGTSSATAVLQAYGITPTTSDASALKLIIDLATDIAYYAPAVCFARSWPGRTYYYQFNEPNPWEGTFKGYATHLLDAVYLFQNFADNMGDKEKEVGVVMATDFIKFVHGDSPWSEYERERGNAKTFGPSEATISESVDKDGRGHRRRDILSRLQEAGGLNLDALSGAWDLFIAAQ